MAQRVPLPNIPSLSNELLHCILHEAIRHPHADLVESSYLWVFGDNVEYFDSGECLDIKIRRKRRVGIWDHQSDLFQLAQVNSYFYQHAIRYLWRHLIPRSPEELKRLARVAKRPPLRGIRFSRLANVPTLGHLCTELDLHCIDWYNDLLYPAFPNIQRLCCPGNHTSDPDDIHVDLINLTFESALRWPKLDCIHQANVSNETLLVQVLSGSPCLTTFEIGYGELVPTMTDQLKHAAAVSSYDLIASLRPVPSFGLVSLTFSGFAVLSWRGLGPFLSKMPTIKSLVIDITECTEEHYYEDLDLPQFLLSLPTSLRRFVFQPTPESDLSVCISGKIDGILERCQNLTHLGVRCETITSDFFHSLLTISKTRSIHNQLLKLSIYNWTTIEKRRGAHEIMEKMEWNDRMEILRLAKLIKSAEELGERWGEPMLRRVYAAGIALGRCE